MAVDDLGHRIVGEPRQLGRQLWARDDLDGRGSQREHLGVALVTVHDAEPQLEVDQHRDPAHALAHVQLRRGHREHPLEVRLGQDVGKDVDLHGAGRIRGTRGRR